MKVHIYVRMTENWGSLPASFRPRGPLNNEKLARAMVLWNNEFAHPYTQYRAEIKKIAMETWEPVADNYIICPDEQLPQIIASLDDEDIIIPTDDDDWFHHKLGSKLKRIKGDYFTWHCVVHQTTFSPNCHMWHTYHDNPCSNNYAVRVKALKSLEQIEQFNMLSQHSKSIKYANQHEMKIYYLFEVLSGYNIHPGSAHKLKSCETKEQLWKIMPKGKRPQFQSRTKYDWIKDYSDRFCEIVESLDTAKRNITLL